MVELSSSRGTQEKSALAEVMNKLLFTDLTRFKLSMDAPEEIFEIIQQEG